MKLIVCVKAVPDPKEMCRIKIDPATKTLTRCDVPLVINPLDRNALEAALEIKGASGAFVTVISMGPPPAGNIVKECMALGADRGILLCDGAFGGADAFATAFTLSKAIEKTGPFDLVFCGMASSDGATEWVGPQTAVFLNIPVVTMVRKIENRESNEWLVLSGWQHGYRRVQVRLPALLTVARELNTPRALSFSGILKARKKVITEWDRNALGIPEGMVGARGSPTVVSQMETVEKRRKVEFLQGNLEEKADKLVLRLGEAGTI